MTCMKLSVNAGKECFYSLSECKHKAVVTSDVTVAINSGSGKVILTFSISVVELLGGGLVAGEFQN